MNDTPTPYAEGTGWVLYHGDSLWILPRMLQGSVDAVVADPPYSSGGATRGDRMASPTTKYVQSTSSAEHKASLPHFGGDNRDQRGYFAWSALWLSACHRLAVPGAPIAVWTDWRQLPVTTDAVQAGGWVWRGIAPWVKPGARPQKGRFAASAEYVVWGSAGSLGTEGNGRCTPGYKEQPFSQGKDRHHITQKPVDVMRWSLGMVKAGGLVLDPFTGSGSTGVACAAEGLIFVGIEQQEAYCEIAARRLREAYGSP